MVKKGEKGARLGFSLGGLAAVTGLGRRVAKCSEHCIDSSLIAGTLRLEPLQYILIDAQRDERLGRSRLKSLPNDAPDNVLDLGFRMLGARRSRTVGVVQASPVSLGFAGSRCPLHALWLCGRR